MPKIRRLDKLPKRKVTIEELLDREETTDAFEDALAVKDDIGDLLIIWSDDGHITWRTNGLKISRTIYLMELIKNRMLSEDE